MTTTAPSPPAGTTDLHVQLAAALTSLQDRLEAHVTATAPLGAAPSVVLDVAALDGLGLLFGLSTFERAVLLLCAGVEMSTPIALACAVANGDARRAHATFGLALAALPDAHWSALAPAAPLRRYRLVHPELPTASPGSLTTAALRLDERILHLLTGVDQPDAALDPFVAVEPTDATPLPATASALVESVIEVWRAEAQDRELRCAAAVQLYGGTRDDGRAVAHGLAAAVGASRLIVLDPVAVPPPGPDLDAVLALLERECVLTGAVVLVEPAVGVTADGLHSWFIRSLLARPALTLVIAARDRAVHDTRLITREIPRQSYAERIALWRAGTGEAEAVHLAGRYHVAPQVVRAVLDESRRRPSVDASTICRERVRSDAGGTARVVVQTARRAELVLPDESLAQLADITREAALRAVVQEQWGFAGSGSGGGTTALFCGPSGTGKTMAASVIAGELDVDVYHVDLSQVVNKYIGETEKNLARVFDAGEASGAVLLFDEADALFGKRTEVKDSHDRYANIEVSYLLQRMEAYTGVAVLTTNLRANLDQAFVRRLRFIVDFPHPDVAQRRTIWNAVFPAGVPLDALDLDLLAQLDVTGGTIRNIALAGAYRAADQGGRVTMAHLRAAAIAEYGKIDRPLTSTELRGWR